jgi:ubiquinone/menaquinone biosynthesis C-methylase UbiE
MLKKYYTDLKEKIASKSGSASYWNRHMVVDRNFSSRENSIDYFNWRNDQYIDYINLMPVTLSDDLVIVDYGCGPGNDLVGFAEYTNFQRLIGIDVSQSAIDASIKRLRLHTEKCEFLKIDEVQNKIYLNTSSVDYVHSSGVLHHAKNINIALSEIYRILKKGGLFKIMVYNKDSIWFHLYSSYYFKYFMSKKMREYQVDDFEYFRMSTDGVNCPISNCYSPPEFEEIVRSHGFKGGFVGAAISMTEMNALKYKYDAIQDERLASVHRDFLKELSYDNRNIPFYRNNVAGIDACYEFIKI